MSGNRTFDILQAAVADFDGVTNESLVKGVCFWKVFIN